MTHSHFIEILTILTIYVFNFGVLDRVFRNCGVRNSEILLHLHLYLLSESVVDICMAIMLATT